VSGSPSPRRTHSQGCSCLSDGLREFKWEEESHSPGQADDPDQDGTTG
jgi:hypothetical protein